MTSFEIVVMIVHTLDRLEAAGLFESDEADALREASEQHWYSLTEAERDELRRRFSIPEKPS